MAAEPRQARKPLLPPKMSIFGAKAGFIIPKNKLPGSLAVRGTAKNEPPAASKEDTTKHAQRKTKWDPDLTLDPTVRKTRALAYQTRLDQITKVLKSGAVEVTENQSSVSAATGTSSDAADNPKQNEGKVELLELERREIIGEILHLNPGYKAPEDYKPLVKETKIPLPTKAHPGYNIIGVLIGPESNTQKRLQEETGAKIRVYGTKKANGEKSEIRQPDINESQDAYEDLYINVSAESYDKVDAAVALIELLLTPVSVNSTASAENAIVSSAVTYGIADSAAGLQVQDNNSQPGLLQYQSHNANWLATPQANFPSISSSGPTPSTFPGNSLQLQPPGGSFSFPPYTGQPPHMNIMPRNPVPVPGPQPSMANTQQPPPQFQANIRPTFGRPPGIVSPQMTPSSSFPRPVRPLQPPHASGGWLTFSPITAQSQRPSQAAPTFMPVRPSISVSPLGATTQLDGPVPVPSQSNISNSYGTQNPPGASFTPSATIPTRPPGGPQSFPSMSPQGSMPMLLPPAGVSQQSSYPLSMQMRPPMSTPAQMRGPPSPFPQAGPAPGMAQVAPSSHQSAGFGTSTSYSQTSTVAFRPPHPASGDFTFRPLTSSSPTPDHRAGGQANSPHGLPQAPLFHPGNQRPIAPFQGFQRPLDGNLTGQPWMHAPPPHFPGAFPRSPAPLQSPMGFRAFPLAGQPGAPSNPPNNLHPHPYHLPPPQQRPFLNTNMQGGNPGGANPIYDPFAPTAVSGAKKKAEADPEYEDLMASVGVK